MGQFLCRVADADGRVFSHVEAASSLDEARQKLVDRGLYVYSVESRGGRLLESLRQKSGRQIGGSEFLILNQQFNTLIKAGLPILKSLDLLASRATSPKLRPVISQIRDRVREGKSLSEAVAEAGVFSKVYSTAILAGEKSGDLPGVLDYYIAYQRVSTGARKKILAALIYPALLISVAVIVVTYLVTVVIPKFALLYRDLNVELPAPTRVLVALTVDYRFVLLGIVALLAAAAAGVFLWSRTEEGGTAFDRFKFRLPVIGDTLLKFQVAVLSHAFDAADRWHAPGGWTANRQRCHHQQIVALYGQPGNPDGTRRRISARRPGFQRCHAGNGPGYDRGRRIERCTFPHARQRG